MKNNFEMLILLALFRNFSLFAQEQLEDVNSLKSINVNEKRAQTTQKSLDDETEQLWSKIKELDARIRKLEDAKVRRSIIIEMDEKELAAGSDEYKEIISRKIFQKGVEIGMNEASLAVLGTKREQLMSEIALSKDKQEKLNLKDQLIDNLKKEIEMLTKALEEERSQTNILLEAIQDGEK